MSELPPERVRSSNPFQFTTFDLFGPYEIKDEVKKRTKLKTLCCAALLHEQFTPMLSVRSLQKGFSWPIKDLHPSEDAQRIYGLLEGHILWGPN